MKQHMPFLGKIVGIEVGMEGPLASPRYPADPALGRLTARMPPLDVARGGCGAQGLFSGPLLRLPIAVTINSLDGTFGRWLGSRGRVRAFEELGQV